MRYERRVLVTLSPRELQYIILLKVADCLDDYDRTVDKTWARLTMEEVRGIRHELYRWLLDVLEEIGNLILSYFRYKSEEMEVHEQSETATRFN